MPFSYRTKVGERFGSRVITEFLRQRDSDGHVRCNWICDCGNKGSGGLKSLRHTINCPRCRPSNVHGNAPTHGHSTREARTHLYDVWANMMQRTRYPERNQRSRNYRNVTVCDDWQTFAGFHAWAVANGYQAGLSIDRIYTCRNYTPDNCEWVTKQVNRDRAKDIWRRHDTTPIEMLWGAT